MFFSCNFAPEKERSVNAILKRYNSLSQWVYKTILNI